MMNTLIKSLPKTAFKSAATLFICFVICAPLAGAYEVAPVIKYNAGGANYGLTYWDDPVAACKAYAGPGSWLTDPHPSFANYNPPGAPGGNVGDCNFHITNPDGSTWIDIQHAVFWVPFCPANFSYGYVNGIGACRSNKPNELPSKFFGRCCEQTPTIGNPIQPASGNKIISETDFQSSGVFPIIFRRNYNSLKEEVGSFGRHWMHSYDRRVHLALGGAVTYVYRDNGSVFLYSKANGS